MVRDVRFAPRGPIRGRYAGRHASRQRGHCIEFNDYREYIPGDEIGDIDWKAYARSDRLFIKNYEHQTDMTVGLLIDASASMAYDGVHPRKHRRAQGGASWMDRFGFRRSKPAAISKDAHISKYDYACRMAASIAYLLTRQQDHVALCFARQGLHNPLEPRTGFNHLGRLLNAMETVKIQGRSSLDCAIGDYTQRLPRRSLMIVFSDLLEPREPILHALNTFTARGGEVIVFQTRHEHELTLPDCHDAVFIDSETGQRVRLSVPEIRGAYQDRLNQDTDAWRRALAAVGIDFHPVSTATHYHEAISDYLFARASRA